MSITWRYTERLAIQVDNVDIVQDFILLNEIVIYDNLQKIFSYRHIIQDV